MADKLPAADCWYLTGATATGKTAVAIALAQRLGAEIVSMDSMAVYRGMDIGTAKPTAEQRTVIPHHLVDLVDPDQEFSVAQYLEAAHRKVTEIRERGHQPLFVGGTPLYLKALLRGLFQGPPANWELRTEIEREVAQVGQEALHKRLQQVDPVAAAAIHPNDTRRLIRALEVYRATGTPISHHQLHFDDARPAADCRVFVMRRPRDEHHAHIDRRVDEMLARGLVDEVRMLTAGGRRLGRTASQAVGYREVLQYLDGRSDLPAMTAQIKTRTRQFAKRQGVWFRSLSECRFVDFTGDVPPDDLAQQIAEAAPAASPADG
ncbi:MAG TPA: tRNA (adenosine(37)-N6)-dimethylallyltransferase MiaA [Lacipirellulaceae bacterium]|nr:tRNA (adenosine(37)-N6)-dimethylallyltransferase MiaA [Lacipirellulaceae bacterium]